MCGRAVDPPRAVECWTRSGSVAQRLICFPHAGAGAAAFQAWSALLPPHIELCALRLPGREQLVRGTPFQRLAPLIDWAIDVLTPMLAHPCVFFGHSLGALIAFDLARELRRRKLPSPQGLLVSGHRAPQLPRRQPPLAGLPDSEFIARVEALGGTPVTEAFAHPELRSLILPALRADFAILENYTYTDAPPFEFSLCIYGGADDPLVPVEDLAPWAEQTRGTFSRRVFPGDHFYLQTQRDALLQEISDACRRLL